MKIRTSANGMIYWGTSPLPAGATCLGKVEIGGDFGALIKTGDGNYHLGKRGKLQGLSKESVEKGLNRSAVFSEIGSIRSDKKAAASAENGRRAGGRPVGSKDTKPRARKKKELS